jgi:hypothetical protein
MAGAATDAAEDEGWLYLIRSNRFGLQYSRKRYFVLEENCLHCFKAAPSSKKEVIIFFFSSLEINVLLRLLKWKQTFCSLLVRAW